MMPARSSQGSRTRLYSSLSTSPKVSSPGTAVSVPSVSYVHAWYEQVNRRALPQPPGTSFIARCRHTLSIAFMCPSLPRTRMISLPTTRIAL